MKKMFLFLILGLACITSFAQKEVIVKAGTLVPLQSINTVRAADVEEGSSVSFHVARDISIDGVTAIPYGTVVKGKVTLAKKSSWWGTKGRLGISINEIVMPDGDVIPLTNGNIKVNGTNRTVLSVILFCFVTIPACLIPGSRAEMQAGYQIEANVAAKTTIKVD